MMKHPHLQVDLSERKMDSRTATTIGVRLNSAENQQLDLLSQKYNLPKATLVYRCLCALLEQEFPKEVGHD